eukprot:TRINITY_DN33040_c0_g1_i2.p1 TRINITY_DN33040_c0_g1~~TRINITY_DN33040_c0_g1_i2.p1  ORF type:complete len:388 (+),score=109.94 TRINITY_DN33040_c0_g1_i2:133-1296(+)
MSERVFLFSSEAVADGHPDKVCDQVADAVLDACLKDDPNAKVACECVSKTGMVMLIGEVSTAANVNYESIIRETIKEIGYDDNSKGLDAKTVNVVVALDEQSPDVANAVDTSRGDDAGAADQGVVCGYATDETPECMPLSHVLATQLVKQLATLRTSKALEWLRPDGKAQVTVEYKLANGKLTPLRVHTVTLSAQHSPDTTQEVVREALMEKVVKQTIPGEYLDANTVYHLNSSGRFVLGGPSARAGLSGRKAAEDTYGGWCGPSSAMSGKDASKIDRAGSYAARWAAKSLVKAGLCHRASVQLTYAMGVAKPVSVAVDSFGSGAAKSGKSDADLAALVQANFDLRPNCIVKELQLRRPVMRQAAANGHFGKTGDPFLWEQPKDLKL